MLLGMLGVGKPGSISRVCSRPDFLSLLEFGFMFPPSGEASLSLCIFPLDSASAMPGLPRRESRCPSMLLLEED